MSFLKQEKEDLRKNLIEEFYFNALNVQKYLKRDHLFAIKIQRQFRRYIKQSNFKNKKNSCIIISKHFKGYLSRNKFNNLILKNQEKKNLQYFNYMASIIQRKYFNKL